MQFVELHFILLLSYSTSLFYFDLFNSPHGSFHLHYALAKVSLNQFMMFIGLSGWWKFIIDTIQCPWFKKFKLWENGGKISHFNKCKTWENNYSFMDLMFYWKCLFHTWQYYLFMIYDGLHEFIFLGNIIDNIHMK